MLNRLLFSLTALLAVVMYLLDCGFFHDHLKDEEGEINKPATFVFIYLLAQTIYLLSKYIV